MTAVTAEQKFHPPPQAKGLLEILHTSGFRRHHLAPMTKKSWWTQYIPKTAKILDGCFENTIPRRIKQLSCVWRQSGRPPCECFGALVWRHARGS
jgi:hypothetical protein